RDPAHAPPPFLAPSMSLPLCQAGEHDGSDTGPRKKARRGVRAHRGMLVVASLQCNACIACNALQRRVAGVAAMMQRGQPPSVRGVVGLGVLHLRLPRYIKNQDGKPGSSELDGGGFLLRRERALNEDESFQMAAGAAWLNP